MKTFKEYNEEAIFGEYWIHDDGGVEYADGDIGDQNHESIVINSVMSGIVSNMSRKKGPGGEMGSDYDYDKGEYVDWDEFIKNLVLVFGSEEAETHEKEWAPIYAALKEVGVTDEE